MTLSKVIVTGYHDILLNSAKLITKRSPLRAIAAAYSPIWALLAYSYSI